MSGYSICIFSTFLYPHIGGVERYAWEMARFLKKSGNNVVIVTTNTEKLKETEIIDGIKIFRFSFFPFLNGRFPILKKKSRFWKFFNSEKLFEYDLFIINMRFYHLSYFASRIAKKYKITSILIEHVTGHFTINNKIFDFIGQIYEHFITYLIRKNINYFYGVSKASANWLLHYGIKANGVIYNGIDVNLNFKYENIFEKYKIPTNAKIILYAGRILKEKGLDVLVDAFNEVIKYDKSVILVIAGYGNYYLNLKQKTEKFKNIYILGEICHNDVLNFINASTIVVNPSSYPEGLPTILLEAGILKKPVIATAVGGTKELIIDNENGYLVETNNPDKLCEAILKILNDESKASELGLNFYEYIKNKFSWEKIIEDMLFEIKNKVLIKKDSNK